MQTQEWIQDWQQQLSQKELLNQRQEHRIEELETTVKHHQQIEQRDQQKITDMTIQMESRDNKIATLTSRYADKIRLDGSVKEGLYKGHKFTTRVLSGWPV